MGKHHLIQIVAAATVLLSAAVSSAADAGANYGQCHVPRDMDCLHPGISASPLARDCRKKWRRYSGCRPLPLEVRFGTGSGSYARYVYSASGERLKAKHYTNRAVLVDPIVGNELLSERTAPPELTYEEAGLWGMSEYGYHGPVAYYPYGAVIADLGTGASVQRFKFGGKELTLQNGLNEYDFGARQYYPAVPHFTGVDPLCEKYYWLSPYLYCANNPVNLVDPDGMDWSIWSERDNENILNIHMQINGVVYSSFKNSIDIDKLRAYTQMHVADEFFE